jgi:HEAT repeat protein
VKVRRRSAELLGAMRAKDSVDGLIALTKDGDAAVRNSAAHALGQIRDARARGALEALVASDPNGLVRDQATMALRRL